MRLKINDEFYNLILTRYKLEEFRKDKWCYRHLHLNSKIKFYLTEKKEKVKKVYYVKSIYFVSKEELLNFLKLEQRYQEYNFCLEYFNEQQRIIVIRLKESKK